MAASKLQAVRLFQISNSFYVAYYKVDDERSNAQTDKERERLEAQASQLRETADTFSQWASENMAVPVSVPVTRLSETIQKAANTLHNLQLAGTALDVVTDLVAIGATLAAAVANPAGLAVLPGQVDQLAQHLKDF